MERIQLHCRGRIGLFSTSNMRDMRRNGEGGGREGERGQQSTKKTTGLPGLLFFFFVIHRGSGEQILTAFRA